MSNLSESVIQKSIIKYFKKYQQLGYPIFIDRRQAGGFSYKEGAADLYVVISGIHIEIETKTQTGKFRSLQEKWQYRCENVWNIPYIKAKSLDEVKIYVKELFPEIFKEEK